MVMGVFAEIRNRLECFCKCNIFVFQIWVKKNSVMFWYWGMFQYCSPDKSLQCCEQGGYRTYSHHCQIADKNPSKSWNGEFWGFRICIGFVQRDFVLWVFLCPVNITLFSGYHAEGYHAPPIPYGYNVEGYHASTDTDKLTGYHVCRVTTPELLRSIRATTLHTNVWYRRVITPASSF